MLQKFRILPLLILVAVAMVTLKIGTIWKEIAGLNASIEARSVRAAEENPAEAAKDTAASSETASGDPAAAPAAGGKPPAIAQPATSDDGGEAFDPRQLSQSEVRLLQALAERRNALDARENNLNQREALLKAAEQRLLDEQAELTAMRQEVKQLLDQVDEQEEKKINNLVKLYEKMKPKDAARILNDLELAVLMRVVQRMNVRRLAPVLAAMEGDKARAVTRRLAEREKGQEEATGRMEGSVAERK